MRCWKHMVSLLLCICLFCPVPMGGAEAPSGETAAEIPYENVREDYSSSV